MKRFFIKLISLMTVVILSFSFLSGCELITTNTERDMAQVIATVKIDDDFNDKIYKRELQSSFATNGYIYMNYYGYTKSETYEKLLDDMVKNRIIIQQSLKALTGPTTDNAVGYFKKASEVPENKRTYAEKVLTTPVGYNGTTSTINPKDLKKTDSLENFLTEYEHEKAIHNVLYQASQLIKSYSDEETEEHDHQYENATYTVRTTLTQATENVGNEGEKKDADSEYSKISEDFIKQVIKLDADFGLGIDLENNLSNYPTLYDLELDLYKKFNSKFEESLTSDKKVKRTLKKIVKELKENGFISSSEAQRKTPTTIEELLDLTYFNDLLKGQMESLIVNKYKLALENEQEIYINEGDALYNEYVALYNSQKAKFNNNYEAYETALGSASESSFVVYHPNYGKLDENGQLKKYGYISNLLVGFSSEQSQILSELEAKENVSQSEINNMRNKFINSLTVEDQRATWVYSNYGDYDANLKSFTFKPEYVKSNSTASGYEYLTKYQGQIIGAQDYIYHDNYDNEKTGYNYKKITPNKIAFDVFYSEALCGIMGFNATYKDASGNYVVNRLAGYDAETTINDSDKEKFIDLIYAYSTDPGSLSENYGYVYSPMTSSTLGQIQGAYVDEYAIAADKLITNGVGSYAVVATNYGYHVMLCTKIITPTSACLTKTEFYNDVAIDGTLAYDFREYKLKSVTTTLINNITNSFINENLENGVKYNKSAYEDLISD